MLGSHPDLDLQPTSKGDFLRAGGVLLHPTALPGEGWAGDFGDVPAFIDWLARHRMSLWQVLPLSPPGPGHSPYTSVSSHAGNPSLVDLKSLIADGLLEPAEIERSVRETSAAADAHRRTGTAGMADLGRAARAKMDALTLAADRFRQGRGQQHEVFSDWFERHSGWLDLDSAFHAASVHHGSTDWRRWPHALARAEPDAIARLMAERADLVHRWRFIQWQFDRQWRALRERARIAGIRIVGDLPIYCAMDSVDVWADQDLFELDDAGMPTAVAGVPPDAFSATGQHWGNPLYRWPEHARSGFQWWRSRIDGALARCDLLRLDHFRGLASYWRIPAGSADARIGTWEPGPGLALFEVLFQQTPREALIIEDLGMLTEDVFALREVLRLPGMRVLQFGFGRDGDPHHLPHNFTPDSVVYTGTHDNDTTLGWWQSADPSVHWHLRDYCGRVGKRADRLMIRLAFASVADLAIVPMQDVIGAGGEARMNRPGEADAQWCWRLQEGQLRETDGRFLARLARLYDRAPPRPATSPLSDPPAGSD
ncbi:MAG: 4-alpha-glucanotransferase [Burkholderiaceae bacterium]